MRTKGFLLNGYTNSSGTEFYYIDLEVELLELQAFQKAAKLY